EGQQTGDQHNFPASPYPHVLGKNMGDRGQARDIELHHRQCRIEFAVDEWPLQTVAGVVDQDVDLNAALTETLVQLDDRRNVRQIDLLHDDLDVELLSKRLGDSLKPVQPARD